MSSSLTLVLISRISSMQEKRALMSSGVIKLPPGFVASFFNGTTKCWQMMSRR